MSSLVASIGGASTVSALEQPGLQATPPTDWRYEMRRTCQEIVPGLFVGPYQSGTKLPALQELGITHILVVTDERETLFLRPRFPDQFVYKVLTVRDAQDQNLIRLFPEATAFIRSALDAGGRVLVHCGDGISRSPAIVTAYVMSAFNLTQDQAFSYVQARRFCVSPNANFANQLSAYQHIHEAQVAISKDPAANLRQNARRKRPESDDEAEGDDGRREGHGPTEQDPPAPAQDDGAMSE